MAQQDQRTLTLTHARRHDIENIARSMLTPQLRQFGSPRARQHAGRVQACKTAAAGFGAHALESADSPQGGIVKIAQEDPGFWAPSDGLGSSRRGGAGAQYCAPPQSCTPTVPMSTNEVRA